MPQPSVSDHLPPSQPAARQRPRSPERVLAEAEEQWIFDEEELARTPSIQDGMSAEKEKEIRAKGTNFIRQVGIMLKLPELTLSTAAIFFNRYLMRMTLVDKPGKKALHHYVRPIINIFREIRRALGQPQVTNRSLGNRRNLSLPRHKSRRMLSQNKRYRSSLLSCGAEESERHH